MPAPLENSSSPSRRRVLSEINVTPFVDVMLVLLIIFMVTAPMMQQGLDVELPETKAGGIAISDEPFVLVIRKNQTITLGTAVIPFAKLGKKLNSILKNRKDKRIYIQADKEVNYGFVAQALSELQRAGLNQVSLVTTFK